MPRTGVLSPHAYFSPFVSVSFPSSTPSRPFSEITLSFQHVIVQGAGCTRARNFITVPLCRLTSQTQPLKAMPDHLLYLFNFRLHPNAIICFDWIVKNNTWFNFQYTDIHVWKREIILRKEFDDFVSSTSWIFRSSRKTVGRCYC